MARTFPARFHGPVSAVIIVERLVDEQQIQIIRAQLAQGFVNGRLRPIIPAVGNPHLRGEEQLFPRNPAFLRRAAYGFLIAVNLRGINRTVADLNRIQHAAFALLSVGNLKNAKPQDRHRNAIVQNDFFHNSFFYCFLMLKRKLPIKRPAAVSALSVHTSCCQDLSSRHTLPYAAHGGFQYAPPGACCHSLRTA